MCAETERNIEKKDFILSIWDFYGYPILNNSNQIKFGYIVLICGETKRRFHWPFLVGKTELFPGRDGLGRLMKLKTCEGKLLKPIQRLVSLRGYRKQKSMNINLNLI